MSDALERFSSGIPGLDVILDGGFFAGGLYLIQGAPGTGKTTVANQICFTHIRAGGRAIYVTLLAEYHARMMQYLGGMKFFDASRIPDDFSYLSGFRAMRESGLTGLLGLIRREIIARRASVLVIDGLVGAQRTADSLQSFNEFVHEMQGIAIATGCTVFLVTSSERHPDTASEHTMVDGILHLGDQNWKWASGRTLQVSKIRGTSYLRGKHTYKIDDDGIVVYPRIEALLPEADYNDGSLTGRVSTGIDALDAMLHGGLPVASPTMMLGPSGIGKTTMGLNFLAGCSAAVPGLVYGFYEPPSRLLVKAQSVCPRLPPLLEQGNVEILWQPPGNESLDTYAHRLLEAVRARQVKRLFLDGLGALHQAFDATERMRQYLPALLNELRLLGVSTLFSLEAGNVEGPNTVSAYGDLSALAENMLLLRYVEYNGSLHRVLSILKVRDSDFDARLYEFMLSDHGPKILGTALSAGLVPAGLAPGNLKLVPSGQPPRND